MNIREQLKGTGVAIVTPFNEDESVDFAALGKLLLCNEIVKQKSPGDAGDLNFISILD